MGTTAGTGGPQPDWYADPTNPRLIRYWNGTSWTQYTKPKPTLGPPPPPRRHIPWWQTWWAVIPGLLLCLPFGLLGLWRRPAVSIGIRVGLTVATIAVYGATLLPNDDPDPRTSHPAPKAAAPVTAD